MNHATLQYLTKRFRQLSCAGFLSFALSAPLSAADTEDTNDTSAGAEMLPIPTDVIGYQIELGDNDWFVVTKGKCEFITIGLAHLGMSSDGIAIYVHGDMPDDPAITSDISNSNKQISLRYEGRGETMVYFRVMGVDQGGPVTYNLQVRKGSINEPIERDITKHERDIKKLKRKKARIETRVKRVNGSRQKMKLLEDIRGIENSIKQLEKKVTKLKKALCTE